MLRSLVGSEMCIRDRGCAGSKVTSTTAPGAWISFSNLVYQWTDIRLNNNNPPWQVLSSQNEPGQCWCFDGQTASMTIKLITKMVPDEFFLYHIFHEYYSKNRIDRRTAAPKSFRVVGVGEAGEEFVLGRYEYEILSQNLKGKKQVFKVQDNGTRWVDHLKVEFEESHWDESRKYTCIYQFGVHGQGWQE
eukprot:TRINITY_DN20952_c0_g2_i4.p1 TRINITY_DN20952_c0_g2~~TRINITY_DN20952_c0_g2_i4.p1  ORF type:complete len:190 (-),score=40.22 TRINITY_DN20952_c0_g2_i4:313-882(-)